ncbi:MAG TPA: acyl-CoA dehydrogenase family protein [Vicinamibacteria bacterium]
MTTAAPERTLSAADILEGAKALAAAIRPRSDEIERARRLPPDVVQMLREAGVFRMNMPRSWGGPEMTPLQQNEVIEELSKADASVGWCAMIGSDSGLYSAFLDPGVAREMFPRLDMIMAGLVYPVGRAERVEGGYRVTGRWTFGSGCTHCDWLAGGCLVYDKGRPLLVDGKLPEWRIMIAPPSSYTIHDTWVTTGLAGSGSHDYEARDLFVPAERTFTFRDESRRPGALYRRPDTFLRKMPAIPLGVARAAIDYVIGAARKEFDMPAMVPYREVPRIQAAVAKAEALRGAARAYVFESLAAQWAKLEAGDEPTAQERASVMLARMNAFQASRDVVSLMYDTLGGSAVYSDKTPLDRHLRDVTTMCQHTMGQRKVREWVGQLLLTGKSDAPFL